MVVSKTAPCPVVRKIAKAAAEASDRVSIGIAEAANKYSGGK